MDRNQYKRVTLAAFFLHLLILMIAGWIWVFTGDDPALGRLAQMAIGGMMVSFALFALNESA